MALNRYARPWLVPKNEEEALREAVQRFGIRTGSLDIRASSLSGGNQQKLALAKVLHPDPRVVVLDEPTRAVDIGAKRYIFSLIHTVAQDGRGIVTISSECIELHRPCNRVVVMRSRKVQTTLTPDDQSQQQIIPHATGTRQRPGPRYGPISRPLLGPIFKPCT